MGDAPAMKAPRVEDANNVARLLALAGLAGSDPENSPERLHRSLFELVLGPELARRAYGPLS